MDVDKIIILIFVLQAVYSLYQKVTGGNASAEAEAMPPPTAEADDGTFGLILERARHQIAGARLTGDRQRARAIQIAGQLSGPAVAPLRAALEGAVTAELDRIDAGLHSLARVLDSNEGEAAMLIDWSRRGDALRGFLIEQSRIGAVISAIEGAARWRDDAHLGPLMADVDAVAAACFAPLEALAKRGAAAWPGDTPISMIAVGDGDAVRAALPDRAVVFLDGDVVDDQTRWPAVIEGIARAVVRTLPDLTAPIRAPLGFDAAWLPRRQGQRVVLDLSATGGRWFEVLAVDTIAAVIAGPVALQGLIARFDSPDDAYEVVRVRQGSDHRQVGATPPPHLRVHLMAAVLHARGFDVEARTLRAGWDTRHGEPEALVLPSLFGPSVHLPTVRMVELLAPLLVGLAGDRHAALGGRAWSEVPGFELTPGVWSRVRKAAEALNSVRPISADARVIALAAVLATERRGGADARLNRAVHRLIQGKGEKAAPDPNYAVERQPGLGDRLTDRDLIDSIVLGAVLRRPQARPMPNTPIPPGPPRRARG